MLNENMVSAKERVAQYKAGQDLLNPGKRKVSNTFALSNLWSKARKKNVAQNPIVANMADILQWTVYDEFSYAAGGTVPTQFEFFTSPIGQGGKTKADTNMTLVSQFPSPTWMNVTHLGFYFNPTVLPIDLDAILDQSYFEFWVNNKVYAEGKIQQFPSGAGVNGFTTNTATSQVTNGFAQLSNMQDLRVPMGLGIGSYVADGYTGITILQQQMFKVRVQLPAGALTLTASDATPNPGTGMVIACHLYGQLSTTVQ